MLLMEREADSERTQADIGVPFFFSGGPHWAAHPLSARPHCQVAMARGWGKAPSPWVDPCRWGGRLPGDPLGHLPGHPFLRGDMPAAGPGDPGRAGLVSGTAGDHADLPLCQRDGLAQGGRGRWQVNVGWAGLQGK